MSVSDKLTRLSDARDDIIDALATKGVSATGHGFEAFPTDIINIPADTPTLQTKTKTYTPTESQQTETITPDTGYDGLSSVGVTVNAISSTYVGSGIARKSSTDLTVSGATVTAPAGYYSSSASKSVSSMTLPTSASSSATSGYTSKATISRSSSNQYINIPPGYNSAGCYYLINSVADLVLPTSASATSSGTLKATIGRSTSNQYINIPTGYNSTASYYTISAVANGSATPATSISGTSATVLQQSNILVNGSLGTNTNGWTAPNSSAVTVTQQSGYINLKCLTTATGTYGFYQLFNPIQGSTASTRQVLYCQAQVRAPSTNTSYPRVYLRYYQNDSTTVSYTNFSAINGASGTALNTGNWITLSVDVQTYSSSTGNYFSFDRIAVGINDNTTNDTMDVRNIMIVNLTQAFGAGNEPDKTWCDQNLSFFERELSILTLNKSVSNTPVVNAGYISSGTAGNSDIKLTAKMPMIAAATINTSSSDQTIAAGTYLTGMQTFRGVTTNNITASNIKSGVTVTVGDAGNSSRILSVTGTYSGGSSVPDASIAAGTYFFRSPPYYPDSTSVTMSLSFTAFGNSYTGIIFDATNSTIKYTQSGGTSTTVFSSNSWVNVRYRYIVIASNTTVSATEAVMFFTNCRKTSYNLLRSVSTDTFSTTSTSQTILPSTTNFSNPIDLTNSITSASDIFSTDKIIYVCIRANSGRQNGYFCGSDNYFYNYNAANNTQSNITTAMRFITSLNSNGTYTYSTSSYGIYCYSLNYNGSVTIYSRYNSNYSCTINDKYNIRIYQLEYSATQGNPYNY